MLACKEVLSLTRKRSNKTRKVSARTWPTAIDLYSGSGAATDALKAAHFRVVAAVDNDPGACATYRLNHPRVRLYEIDIKELDPTVILRDCLKGVPLDLAVICAPCQPFSSQNRKRGGDARSRLLIEGARFVSVLKPKVVFVENVPGLASTANANLLAEFQEECGSDYIFGAPECIDAADYGVPQRRVRCLVMAALKQQAPQLPSPTTPVGKRRTVRDAIGTLRALALGEIDPQDPIHAARVHRPITVKRLQAIPKDGGSRSNLPSHLILNCHKDHRGHPDVYGRMKWDDVAPTLTTGCTDVTRGRFAHPDEDRAITPREASLLQTFRAGYKFTGHSSIIAEQIGNAIPFSLLHALTPAFRATIKQSH